MGFDFDQLFPSKYLKAGDFRGRDVTITIAGVQLEELEGERGKQTKGIVEFKESPKRWVLNRTNASCLRAMFGRNTDDWIGKRVTLFPAPIDFGDAEIAIRVRGSPDIPKTMDFELKLPRKKARKVTLTKTVKPNGKAAPQPSVGDVVATTDDPAADVDLPPDILGTN